MGYTMSKEEARKRLLQSIPDIRLAFERASIASPNGRICFAVMAKENDMKGVVVAVFDGEPFFQDLVTALGANEGLD